MTIRADQGWKTCPRTEDKGSKDFGWNLKIMAGVDSSEIQVEREGQTVNCLVVGNIILGLGN